MTSLPAGCVAAADDAFGPRVDIACRAFDFAIFFEDLFFSCLPSALFLLLFPVASRQLWRQPRRVEPSKLLLWKLVALSALLICQVVFLALRRLNSSSTWRSHASVAADVLQVVSIAHALVLSFQHHSRSIRPSTLLILFLSAMTLVDIARVRTLWLIPEATDGAIVLTLSLVLTLVSMIVESIEKGSTLTAATMRPATPEPFSGFWTRATFAWLAGTFRSGYTTIFSVDDLPDLDPKLNNDMVAEKLRKAWSQTEVKTRKYALLRACLRAYRGPFLAAILPRLLYSGFTFCQPFLIERTVVWVGAPEESMATGKGLIGAFSIVYMGMAVTKALHGYQTFRFTIRLRGGLISLVHGQTVCTRAMDLGEITAVTLMGTDVERIMTSFRFIHELWACLVEMGVAVFLLQKQVGVASLVPILIVIFVILVTFKISAATNVAQRLWVEKIEDRLRLTSHVLENIKAVKMLGISDKMSSVIQKLRQAEIVISATFRKLLIWNVVLSNLPSDLAPMATFVVYVVIAIVRNDSSLLAARAFTSLSLISLVTVPVMVFNESVPAIIQCMGCFDRIQEYCSTRGSCDTKDNSSPDADSVIPSIGLQKISSPRTGSSCIEFNNHSSRWGKTADTALHNINLAISYSNITMIVGPVGSGKSTLLESILGETLESEGRVDRNFIKAAYCSQIPWLQSQTIRQNIIGALNMEDCWYHKVVWACGLETDLARLPRGDETCCRQQWANIKRGAEATHLLLDDVFSGIDATATETISRRLFAEEGLFRQLQMTVVLATHSKSLIQYADKVVVLGDGRVIEAGSLEALRSSNANIQALNSATSDSNQEMDDLSNVTQGSHVIEGVDSEEVSDTTVEEVINDTKRQAGDFSVYSYCMSAAGVHMFLSFLVMTMLFGYCREFPTVWLKWWTEANAESPNSRIGVYLGIYILLGLSGLGLMIAALWLLLVIIVSRTALRMHSDLLVATFRAPFQFFHRVDVGNITNRFSQDMDLIDMAFPLQALNFTSALCTCFVKVFILAAFAKYLGVVIPFLGALVFIIQKFYLRISRQMRLLDIEAKAPLYTHFLELVSGATTIRAFGWQAAFDKTCLSLLNFSQRPLYMLYCIQQCLGFVLDMVVTVLVVGLLATVVFLRDSFNSGDVGVALTMVMTFNSSLMMLIKNWTLMETSVGAVSRVKDYAITTDAEEDTTSLAPLPADWPSTGAIQLSGLVAGHSPSSPPVLKGVSMAIRAGEKIAICGPSGSGKTSLILALLRMIEIQQGSITIDGANLSNHPRADVRLELNVVTQESFLLAGTVRLNLDPFQSALDEDIIRALRKLGLWDVIVQQGGLDMQMKATSWSMGQRQLLCLGRAMVRKSKVLILDEATSR
ncbi:hypothetical protein SCARD494_10727 [Seiridium cardinale]